MTLEYARDKESSAPRGRGGRGGGRGGMRGGFSDRGPPPPRGPPFRGHPPGGDRGPPSRSVFKLLFCFSNGLGKIVLYFTGSEINCFMQAPSGD